MTPIDPDVDFAAWYADGGDPDRDCEQLARWHQVLWSRPVTGVEPFALDVIYDRGYELRLTTKAGAEFRLAGDGIIATYSYGGWLTKFDPETLAEVTRDPVPFYRVASTIGGYLLFPRNGQGQTGPTINQVRGTLSAIRDRFDLTLECIRRHYAHDTEGNPMGECLNRYRDFFALFGDFATYARFFLLEDLLTNDGEGVRSLLDGARLTGFTRSPLPATPVEYARFRSESIDFVTARNERIRRLDL